MKHLAGLLFALLLAFGPTLALALEPDEILADPALEARAKTISQGLRCLVCQNESIEESGADLARDLRVLVRQRVTLGDSDDAVRAYIVARYGEFVLLQPVFAPHTLLLWFAAPGLALVGIGVLVVKARRRREPVPVELTPEEEAALAQLAAGDVTPDDRSPPVAQ